MASPNLGDKDVSDSAIVRAALPGNTVKRLARLMGVPFDTAKHWTYRNISNARRQELARTLLQEMDRQDVERGAWRRVLAEWAAEQTGER